MARRDRYPLVWTRPELAALALVAVIETVGRSAAAQPTPEHVSRAPEPAAGRATADTDDAGDPEPAVCTESPEACGKRAFDAGIQAFESGDYPAALRLFREAQAARPHPTILFNVALAESRLDELVSALEHLDQLFRDPATPGPLLERIRAERDYATARLARVAVEGRGAELYVDGVRAPGDPPSTALDPGPHRVRVVVDGAVVTEREVLLGPGERIHLSVATRPAVTEHAGPSAPAPPAEAPAASIPEPRAKPLRPAWVVGGSSVALLLAGAAVWSGLDTRNAFGRFQADADSLSEPEARARRDDGRDRQLRTNMLVGASLLVAAGTATLAFTLVEWPRSRGQTGGARIGLGPTFVAVEGRF